ncbi:hypothetical protein [Paractinoplanes globisporus]|uniref:SMODS and SLOG-associating 2TM effector domain-containing protein n=1 Tax=Paractinoplanes globisporus TaxID=113565 RepID=A0ABW6WX99_9ACTN|nr:hypothetical protein [Actinoplanes globisporus]
MVYDEDEGRSLHEWPRWSRIEPEASEVTAGGEGSVASGVIFGDIVVSQISGDSSLVLRLRAEIKELAETANLVASAELKSARRWGRIHLILGLPTAVVAAVSGATALASTAGRVPAGVLALCAAAMSAASGFLGSEAKGTAAEQRAAALSTLATDARILSAFDLEGEPSPGLRRSLVDLADRLEAIRANDLEAAKVLKARARKE